MKLIKSKAEYLPQASGLEGVYRQIELAGRTAYKSEYKITSDSAESFFNKMVKAKHYAALEHGTVYLKYPENGDFVKYYENPYSIVRMVPSDDRHFLITTNFRVLEENGWTDDLQYLCEPTEFHERRYTFKFTTDRGISHELVRHRTFSFLQESTRYCNYFKDKFGNITFIIPHWMNLNEGPYETVEYQEENYCSGDGYFKPIDGTGNEEMFLSTFLSAEANYLTAIEQGLLPQDARQLLPMALKTELIMTGFTSDWKYLIDLRLLGKTGKPHPDMVLLMEQLQKVAKDTGIWNDIMKYPSRFE